MRNAGNGIFVHMDHVIWRDFDRRCWRIEGVPIAFKTLRNAVRAIEEKAKKVSPSK